MEERQALVRQARLGNAEAFSKLYEQIYQDLYRFALYTLKNSHDAEDVVSETVIAAYQSIRSLRRAEAFRPWIFRILTNRCKQKLKQYLTKTTQLPEDLTSEGRDICQDLDVRHAFSMLGDEDRLILSMNLFAGYNSREIARELGMNDNTVRSRQSRALKKMEEILSGERRQSHG